MAMVLQYGVANIVNATLNLLQVKIKLWIVVDFFAKDEEEEVREAAANFASGLPRTHSKVVILKHTFTDDPLCYSISFGILYRGLTARCY